MRLDAGKNPPKEINVLVEISQNGEVKYEFDKEKGILMVDRFLYTAMSYPFNYGFIPKTKADDGDPVDVLVISSKVVQPGTILPSRPIGLLEMEDEAGEDTKIIALPTKKIDPFFGETDDITQLSEAIREKIKHFFEHYKELEKGKWVKIRNWQGRGEAEAMIKNSLVA